MTTNKTVGQGITGNQSSRQAFDMNARIQLKNKFLKQNTPSLIP